MAMIKGKGTNDTLLGTAGEDDIFGLGGDDFIQGLEDRDRLFGGLGDDYLDGGRGGDLMSGGRGSDTFVVDDINDKVIEHFPAHTPHQASEIDAVLTTLAAFTLSKNLENLAAVAPGNFVGIGNELANHIQGNAGDDMLRGRDGDDHLEGFAGDDFLIGGRASAKGAADLLEGGEGNDKLSGGSGIDVSIGGPGNDVHFVDNEWDVVVESVGEGRDAVSTLTGFTLPEGAEVENLVLRPRSSLQSIDLTGNEVGNRIVGGEGANTLEGMGGNDNIFGLGGQDIMIGGTGHDKLRGQADDDILYGGVGNDLMNGGLGADTFVLETGFGEDRIFGFEAASAGGDDRIDLSVLGIQEGDFGAAMQIQQSGRHARITIGADAIILISTDAATIDPTSFLFA